MTEGKFWEIVDSARAGDNAFDVAWTILSSLNRSDLLAFTSIMRAKMAEAYTFPLLAANFVISSYVSDDGFEDFRAWLVWQGREKFTAALADVESIADWLDKEDVDSVGEEDFAILPNLVFEERFAGDLLTEISFAAEPELDQDWPETESDYRRRWPKLVERFWDQEKIRQMHQS